MIIEVPFRKDWSHKGHIYGTCMSKADADFMYVNIPKNASSWTKPNLLDWGWEFYNYHSDNLDKTAIVVLRDPVDRWVSGVAEYLTLYHSDWADSCWNNSLFDLIFDVINLDDHTDRQVNFLNGLDTDRCVFFWFSESYRRNFSAFLIELGMPNRYFNYEKQHVSDNDPVRKKFKEIISEQIKNPKYLDKVAEYFQPDYKLISSVDFYAR